MYQKLLNHLFVGCTLISGTQTVFAETSTPTPTGTKPNVILILVDDMGWKDLGCMGSTYFQTPNIDKMASEGALFTHAYATSPVSSPSRGAIFTGKYPARTGFTTVYGVKATDSTEIWHPYSKSEITGKNSQYKEAMNLHVLPLKEYTFAEALRDAGYKTALVGKWHCGWHENFSPDHQGFEYTEGYRKIPSYTSGHLGKHYINKVKGLEGLKPEDDMADVLTEKAVEYIKANKDNPFLLVLSHFAVHNPCEAKSEVVEKYKKLKGDDQNHPVYAAMVESVDKSVERIMQTLDELKLSENTLVVFTSDNGGLTGVNSKNAVYNTSNYPLSGGKSMAYEAGMRVPMIVKWPGKVKEKSVIDVPVIGTDLYPTFLDVTHTKLLPEQHKDGVSLLPLLSGKGIENRELYFHFPHYTSYTSPFTSVVDNGWKLIHFYNDAEGGYQLFNLTNDPYELHDLSAKYPKKVKELMNKISKWCVEVDAKLPRKNPDYNKKLPATCTGKDAYETARKIRERCEELYLSE